MATRWKKELKKGNISASDAYRIKKGSEPKGSFKEYAKKENQIQESNKKAAERIANIMKQGFGGLTTAYRHPVTQKLGSGLKTVGGKTWSGTKTGAGLMGGLAVGTLKAAKHSLERNSNLGILVFPILLLLFDFFIASFQGLRFTLDSINFQGILGFIQNSPFIIVLGLFFLLRRPTKEEIPFMVAVTALFVYISAFIGYHPWVLVHLVFAMFVFSHFLKGFDRNVPISSSHWFFLLIVIWDIFDFPLFQLFNSTIANSSTLAVLSNKLLFPIWLFYFFIFIKEGGAKTFLTISLWLFYMGFFSWSFFASYGSTLVEISAEEREAAISAPKTVFQNYIDLFGKYLTGQIQYAITGKVEENQYEQLGVYLEDMRSAQSKYFEKEAVVVWGTVKARTLDDPINIQMGCFIKDGDTKIIASEVVPENRFSVFTLEEQDFACTFEGLKAGSKTITTFADFNFETLAFLKVYFIDRDRQRAMTREGLDPLEEFDIKDRNPVAVYTNGPADIGLETTNSLIGVSKSYLAKPRFSLSIQNRQGWEGKITALKELILLFPIGVTMDPTKDCINSKFTLYDESKCSSNSCQKFVYEECNSVCKGYEESDDRVKCQITCDERKTKCQDDCKLLFAEDEGDKQFNAYSLDEKQIEKINEKITQGEFKNIPLFFSCQFNPKPSEVLGNTPITTKSFRVKARYNYTVEKSVSVRIDKLPKSLKDKGEIPTGSVEVPVGASNVKKEVIRLANNIETQKEVLPSLIVAIADVESDFLHCKDGTLNCGTNRQDNVNCNEASCGVMQINKNAHPDLFLPGAVRLKDFGCGEDQTVYDFECNIKSGAYILKQYYDFYGNDELIYNNKVDTTCLASNNPEQNKKYKDYTYSWDRALRAYNGFGCTKGANVNYVEEVRENLPEN